MGVILVLSPTKTLSARIVADNYKTENIFEDCYIYLPKEYNDKDILSYTIQLNVLNSDDEGDVISLTDPIENKGMYMYKVAIPLKWTYKAGTLTLWIKFIGSDETIGLTNEVHIPIRDSKEIEDYIPEQTIGLLDEWTLRMNELYDDTVALEQRVDDAISKIEALDYVDDGYWLMFGKENV